MRLWWPAGVRFRELSGGLSPAPQKSFLARNVETGSTVSETGSQMLPHWTWPGCPMGHARQTGCSRAAIRLVSIGDLVSEPEHAPLPGPLDRCINEAGETNAAWQPAIHRSAHEIRGKERERDHHHDVTLAAAFPGRDLVRACSGAIYDLLQPSTAERNRAHESGSGLGPDGAWVLEGRRFRFDEPTHG